MPVHCVQSHYEQVQLLGFTNWFAPLKMQFFFFSLSRKYYYLCWCSFSCVEHFCCCLKWMWPLCQLQADWLACVLFYYSVTECTLRQLKLLCSQNLRWCKVFCNIVTLRPSMRSFLSMHGPFRSLFCFVRSVIGTLRFLLLCQQCTWRSVLYLVLYFSTCSIFYYPGN